MSEEKTAKKTAPPSPRSGVSLPLGNHPGNTGGKPGRSGRKPSDFIQWCQDVTDNPTVRDVQLARAKSGDIKILDLAARYGHGIPKQLVEHSGDVTFRVVYDEDSAPDREDA